MSRNRIQHPQAIDRSTQELGSLIATNRSLRDEVVSLILDITILREKGETAWGSGSLAACRRGSPYQHRFTDFKRPYTKNAKRV